MKTFASKLLALPLIALVLLGSLTMPSTAEARDGHRHGRSSKHYNKHHGHHHHHLKSRFCGNHRHHHTHVWRGRYNLYKCYGHR